MKRVFSLLVILVLSFPLAWAQDQDQTLPLDLFYRGTVVLKNGDTIKGMVKYDLNDLVQVLHDRRTEIFSAQKVSFFEIVDQSQTNNHIRLFYSLPYSLDSQYKTPIFFELISKGKITVLSREQIEVHTSRGPGFHQPTRETVIVNRYFLLHENGAIEDFSRKPGKWYELMGNQADAVREYVRNNKLDFGQKYQFKNIIDHFNSLTKQSIFSCAKTSDFSIER